MNYTSIRKGIADAFLASYAHKKAFFTIPSPESNSSTLHG